MGNKTSAPVMEHFSINGAGKDAFVMAFNGDDDDPLDFQPVATMLKKKSRTATCWASESDAIEDLIFRHTGLKIEQIMMLMKAVEWNNVSVESILRFVDVCHKADKNMVELYVEVVVNKMPPS
jgi:hypothetical protein